MKLIEQYLASWNEKNPAARRKLIEEVFADGARYVDPMAVAEGHEAIDATIAAVQGQFPDFVFAPISDVDAHHDIVRFLWGLGPAGAEPIVIGFDVAVLDADGRITQVHGFLDKVPSA